MSVSVAQEPALRPELSLLYQLSEGYEPRDFAIRFWDGTTAGPDSGQEARFTVVLNHPGALRRMLWPFNQKYALGEAFIYGDFDVDGDLSAFLLLLKHWIEKKWTARQKLSLLKSVLALPGGGPSHKDKHRARMSGKVHSPERDQQAITYHFDLSNDFFELWLDKRMAYTCAYFKTPTDDIDTAQEQKFDHVCRKLRLKPGERLLDIGCGWGGFALFAAERYGVESLGVTLSKAQAEFANQRVRKAGLEGRCRVQHGDFREIKDARGFDKISSIGMIEHLGGSLLPSYFQLAWRLLPPGGVFLSHGISACAVIPEPKWRAFGRRYVFPDGELVPVSQLLVEAEKAGFEIRDVENLREHYALTLEHWARRLEARQPEAIAATDEVSYRIYRLYLTAVAHSFRNRTAGLHQCLLVKPDHGRSGLPLTREDWYR